MEDVSILDVKPKIVLGMHRRGAYENIPIMIKTVCEFAIKNKIQIAEPPMFLCHETSVEEVKKANEEKNALVEVVVPISKAVEGSEEIKCYELAGGKMAKIIHKGPYEECEPTYNKLFAWIGQKGKRIVGPIREVYLNDPREVSPDEIVTEIYVPIQ